MISLSGPAVETTFSAVKGRQGQPAFHRIVHQTGSNTIEWPLMQ